MTSLRYWSLCAGSAVACICCFYLGRATARFRQVPALVATLPGDEAGFGQLLDARLRELFPVGTDAAKLAAELSRQGFTPEWRTYEDAAAASFVWQGLLCTRTARVKWRTDQDGKLTEVGGAYEAHCDL